MRIKFSDVRPQVRALGLTCRWQTHIREWRIDYRTGDPRKRTGASSSTYFTPDHVDAIRTAIEMSKVRVIR